MKHLRIYADSDDMELLNLACDGCDEVLEVDLCEPNSFGDLYIWMRDFKEGHKGCAKKKAAGAVKKPKRFEPDPMASAQAAVLRERLETFDKS